MVQLPKITFFGTHDFGRAMLTALISSGLFTIEAVVTQPDRPVGRGQELQESAVKKVALQNSISIFQPDSLKKEKCTSEFPQSDLFVVCQYGLIIPEWVLDIPKKGTINVHTSLLPQYRGASPIQTALLHGETETGVTIMLMDAKMDHGAILAQQNLAIEPDETYLELSKKMEPVAANLLALTLPMWLTGSITPEAQDESKVTLCKMFTREDGKIDFTKSATEIYNQYRGLTPWPGIWTMWNGKRLKLLQIKKSAHAGIPGKVLNEAGKLFIGCGTNSLEIIELQLEGKKAMTTQEFLNGFKEIVTATLPN